MERIEAFSFATNLGPQDGWPATTRLFYEHRDTGTDIPGFTIEGQYRCNDGYLLITSFDCPFEESNEFILLDNEFNKIAQHLLFAPYYSFSLHAHWPIGPRSLRLHYYTECFYTLTICDTNKLLLKPYDAPQSDLQAHASIVDLDKQRRHMAERFRFAP